MATSTAHPAPDRKQLRDFGLIMAGGLIVIFGLFFPWLTEHASPRWPWIAGGIFAATGLVIPMALGPLYRAWMKIGEGLGWINTRIILGLVFFLLFMPVALVMRILGKDPMKRRFEKTESSYRVASHSPPREQLEKPY